MLVIKYMHMTFAIVTVVGFVVRGVWMIRNSPRLQKRWVKIVPHINDTLLLVTAIVLAVGVGQYPVSHDWLTVKVVALLIYIFLGTVALKRGRTMAMRVSAWIGALATVLFIFSVAFTRTPAGVFAYLG